MGPAKSGPLVVGGNEYSPRDLLCHCVVVHSREVRCGGGSSEFHGNEKLMDLRSAHVSIILQPQKQLSLDKGISADRWNIEFVAPRRDCLSRIDSGMFVFGGKLLRKILRARENDNEVMV